MLNSQHYSKQSQHFDLEYQKSPEHINDIANPNVVNPFLKFTRVTLNLLINKFYMFHIIYGEKQ